MVRVHRGRSCPYILDIFAFRTWEEGGSENDVLSGWAICPGDTLPTPDESGYRKSRVPVFHLSGLRVNQELGREASATMMSVKAMAGILVGAIAALLGYSWFELITSRWERADREIDRFRMLVLAAATCDFFFLLFPVITRKWLEHPWQKLG